MLTITADAVWRRRLESIDSQVDDIQFPQPSRGVKQDEEWCDVVVDGRRRRVRFHDYSDIFQIPGLYEELFYNNLQCCSPVYVTQLLESVVREAQEETDELRVLDLGAGNGMMGDELHELGVQSVVGVDVIPAAKEATLRDRPGVYQEYLVLDMANLDRSSKQRLQSNNFNCLTCVAALGFGDIPPTAFMRALELIEPSGWVAITIKENFISENDSSGFAKLIRCLSRDGIIQIRSYHRFRHRISITGEPLYYVALVAQKLKKSTAMELPTNPDSSITEMDLIESNRPVLSDDCLKLEAMDIDDAFDTLVEFIAEKDLHEDALPALCDWIDESQRVDELKSFLHQKRIGLDDD